jgi:phosphoribosylformylglycinamidine cyclo-ligase
MRYRDAGVDIAAADSLKHEIVSEIRSTWGPGVVPLSGGFAGIMSWPDGGALMAATMDGVGTKLHLAMEAGRLGDAAADLVYHGANDLLVHGARPVAFLDYVAQSRLDPRVVADVVRGLARACREVGAALIGGETAQMPDTYLEGVVDVAGCMLGAVDPGHLLEGSRVTAGSIVLGLAADGLHTNGFSLARRILAQSKLGLADPLPRGAGESVGEALLRPHRWYGPALMSLIAAGRIQVFAHVTGGGLSGNLVRVLPPGLQARVQSGSWPRPPLFEWLIEAGGVPEEDARSAFNLGIGMVAVVTPGQAPDVRAALAARETVYEIGSIGEGECAVVWT